MKTTLNGLFSVARGFRFLILIQALLFAGNFSLADAPTHGKKVVGYFIEWGTYARDYMVKDMPADKVTHVNFAFMAPFMLSGVYTQFSSIAADDYLKSDGSHPNQPLYVVGAATCSVNGVTYSVGLAVDDTWACFQKCNYPRRYQATPAYGWRTNIFSSWDMPTGEGVKGANDRTAGIFGELLGMKNAYPHVKVMPSIGGWSYSYYFCDIARTNASRQAFAAACRQTLDLFAGRDGITDLFDGVDLDWEFPYAGGDSAITHDPNDKEHLTALCQAVRAQIGADKIFTIATAQGYQNISNQYDGTLEEYLDWVSIMAYDYNGYTWSLKTGFNAPLFGGNTNDPLYNSTDGKYMVIDEVVQAFLGQGINPTNLVLGLPFYGRTFGNVTDQNHGEFQSFSGPGIGSYENGVVEFNDICDGTASNKVLSRTSSGEWVGTNGYTRYWDSISQVPFLFNGSCWITYDDDVSLADKVGYAKAQGLGGVMIWDLSCDTHDRTDFTSPDPYILINAIDTALRQVVSALSISPSNRSHTHSAVSGVVTVSANVAWTAESTQPGWLSLTGDSQGTTNGTITYVVAENCGPSRAGVISITGGGLKRDFTVNQEAFIAEPLSADFDGDRKADPALYNTNGTWKIKLSTAGYAIVPLTGLLGGSEYSALAADFDGDGKADPAIYSAGLELWVVKLSSLNYLAPTVLENFGGADWQAVGADFDGDRLADPALYNTNGTWKIKLSTAGYTTITKNNWLGYPSWQALAADFDGDGLADPAIYRASNGAWIIMLSKSDYNIAVIDPNFLGSEGFIGLAADFDNDGHADPTVAETTTGHWQVRLYSNGYSLVDLPNYFGE